MKKSATEPCRLWIRPSPCWTAAQRVTTAAGYCRFSLMQSGVLHPCQGRSGEDRAGQQSLYQYPSKLLCAKVWGSVCISLIWPVFLTSFHHSVAIRKRKTNPCGISSTGKTQLSSEVKTFLPDWPQVLKTEAQSSEGRQENCNQTVWPDMPGSNGSTWHRGCNKIYNQHTHRGTFF